MKFYKRSNNASSPVKVYDLSICNIEDRKRNAITFPTKNKAMAFLGIKDNRTLNAYTSRNALLNKERYYSSIHNREFAIRLVRNN